MRLSASVLRPLVLSCHPGPAFAVTAVATLLAVGAGAQAGTAVLVAAAFGTGQLSIGWSNDWLDADRDAVVQRRDKPLATGRISRRPVGIAALVAAALCVPLSLALGPLAGVAHLLAVASAWSYNLLLKSSVWSWLPFAFSFGLLPAIVGWSLPGRPDAPLWAVATGALLGVAAHLLNVLPDLEDDRATGVRGLAHRLGRTRTSLLAAAVLLSAAALVTLGPSGSPAAVSWAGLVLAIVLTAVACTLAVRRPASRLPFLLVVAVAGLAVVQLIATGADLS
jgi:4-hydroxybenzoate polyprenyltransferase